MGCSQDQITGLNKRWGWSKRRFVDNRIHQENKSSSTTSLFSGSVSLIQVIADILSCFFLYFDITYIEAGATVLYAAPATGAEKASSGVVPKRLATKLWLATTNISEFKMYR